MLGQRIYELRSHRGWSQVQLAQRLSITKQTVSNWENGNILPSIEMLIRLTQLFQVSADYLLGLEQLTHLDVTDLPPSFVMHLAQIIEDYRSK